MTLEQSLRTLAEPKSVAQQWDTNESVQLIELNLWVHVSFPYEIPMLIGSYVNWWSF